MGHPKKQRRKYTRPKRPFDKDRIESERKISKDMGLKRKKEIWKAESILRDFRRRARELQAYHDENKEKELLDKLNKLGLAVKSLEDVLEISLENILSRRLQTILYKKGITSSIRQSRHLIVHGHILVDNKKIFWPGYIVPVELEDKVGLDPVMKKNLIEPVKDKAKKEAPKEEKPDEEVVKDGEEVPKEEQKEEKTKENLEQKKETPEKEVQKEESAKEKKEVDKE